MQFMSSRFVYWASTGIFGLVFTVGGAANVLGFEEPAQGLRHLGFPAYLGLFLGAAQLFAVGAVLAPGLPLLKEWAYAGLCFLLMARRMRTCAQATRWRRLCFRSLCGGAGACSYLSRPPERRLA